MPESTDSDAEATPPPRTPLHGLEDVSPLEGRIGPHFDSHRRKPMPPLNPSLPPGYWQALAKIMQEDSE